MLSEILAPLFGCHQQLLLDDLRGRWSFGMKSELEVSDDLINDFMILDKGDIDINFFFMLRFLYSRKQKVDI